MKAVLVMEMPNACAKCPMFDYGLKRCESIISNPLDAWDSIFEMDEDGKVVKDDTNARPSWCPLRPLPDKQKNRPQTGGYTRGFTAGFNKFRYLITGETE